MKKALWIALSIFILIGGGLIGVGFVTSNVETPAYNVLQSEQEIELRCYDSMIIAEVEMSGERQTAINQAFRLLADYIFGNNTVSQEIAMTAPVQQESTQEIAMTAPVQQEQNGDSWKVSFVMPAQYTMQTLPRPNNEQVVLKAIPEQTFAAIRFSGLSSDENIQKYEAVLKAYIEEHKLPMLGEPKYAFYNPPWTLPFMRRNEIMIPVVYDCG